MANIKISELNALTERADNDLLAIVDTSADETKKIQVSDLVNKNIELIAVSDTAPSECSIGDKYYNTTDKEIYTATGTNTWSETGTTPISGILYILITDQKLYNYDGTDLVMVGGAGSIVHNNYSESTTEPYSANYVNNNIPSISNIYGTSQTDGYSQEYINSLPYVKSYIPADRVWTYNTNVKFYTLPNSTGVHSYIITGVVSYASSSLYGNVMILVTQTGTSTRIDKIVGHNGYAFSTDGLDLYVNQTVAQSTLRLYGVCYQLL